MVWKGDAQALVLRRNWRGNVAGATQVVGTTLSYTPTWPAAISDIRYAPDALLSAPPANSWWGSLALDQRDATGLLYRRNRYYDPQTGRFTQEDPIGLAGGLNLYGYAGGDPVNFSDPFGLCASASDSVQTTVTVDCGDQTTSKKTIWVQQASAEEAQGVVAATDQLGGGSRRYTPAAVQGVYQQAAQGGRIFALPMTVDGYPVLEGGVTELQGAGSYVALRQDVLDAARSGNISAPIGNRGATAGTVIGHEGVHMLGGGEIAARLVRWIINP